MSSYAGIRSVATTIDADGDRSIWRRRIGGHAFSSVLSRPREGGRVSERFGPLTVDLAYRRVLLDDVEVALTRKEYAVLAQLAQLLAELPTAQRPKLLYTVPNFSNPRGTLLSATRRSALVELAQRDGFDLSVADNDVVILQRKH